MGLTVIVGDVHGCAAELEDALEQLQFAEGYDRLIFVGDLVVRGPDSVGVLALARRLEARVVRGNHEDKLLAWHHHARPLGPEHERVARALSDEDWQMLDQMPLWIDLPDHGVRVVHAGVVPGVPIGRAPPDALLKMRTIDAHAGWSDEQDAGPLWGSLYQGGPHVIFGHNARAEPQLHDWATGIDT
ncbi:MAG: metallophosphoesterase, partial [Myxococcota bacterium]|nr:metallophosphoesterase [Myxococcota bacterium]